MRAGIASITACGSLLRAFTVCYTERAMIRAPRELRPQPSAPMSDTALRSKLALTDETFSPPEEELLPLRWSIAIWLVLAAASWGAVYFVLSLIL